MVVTLAVGITVLVFKEHLFHLIMAPEHKSRDDGSLDVLKRSHKAISLNKKVKVLNLIRTTVVC